MELFTKLVYLELRILFWRTKNLEFRERTAIFFPLLDYISEIKLVCDMKEKGDLEYTTARLVLLSNMRPPCNAL